MRLDRFTLRQVCRRTPAVVFIWALSRAMDCCLFCLRPSLCACCLGRGRSLYIYTPKQAATFLHFCMCGYLPARKKKRHDIDRKIVEREKSQNSGVRKQVSLPYRLGWTFDVSLVWLMPLSQSMRRPCIRNSVLCLLLLE
jgi:hypothetical protein